MNLSDVGTVWTHLAQVADFNDDGYTDAALPSINGTPIVFLGGATMDGSHFISLTDFNTTNNMIVK